MKKKLKAKIRAAIEQQQNLRNAAVAEGRSLTEEEQSRFNSLQAEIDSMNSQLRELPDDEPEVGEPSETAAE